MSGERPVYISGFGNFPASGSRFFLKTPGLFHSTGETGAVSSRYFHHKRALPETSALACFHSRRTFGMFLVGLPGNTLFDFGAFSDFLPDIVEFGPPDLAGTDHFNLGDPGGMEGKNPFNPDAVGIFSDRKSSTHLGIFYGNHQTFVDLDPFVFAFHNLEMNLYRIPNPKLVKFRLHLIGFNRPYLVHLFPAPQ
jgi:hypothetical protein